MIIDALHMYFFDYDASRDLDIKSFEKIELMCYTYSIKMRSLLY